MGAMDGIKKLIEGMKGIVTFTKCSIKMLTNFYKCAIYYVLDIFKYIFFFLIPGLILVCFGVSWKKTLKIYNRYKYLIAWSNATQNDCYRCKNKKAKKTDWFKNVNLLSGGKDKKSMETISFYTLFVVIICLMVLAYSMYYWFINKK